MTTQARELAGIITNAGDLLFDDDVTLKSDGAVLNFGADSDVTLTHVADTALLLNSTRRLQFGDSGTYIYQSADGVLNLTSDTEVEINATIVDINANVDISGTLTVAGALDFGDLDISNVGSIALDTITNDGTDITLDSSGDIILDADGGDTKFRDGGAGFFTITNSSLDAVLKVDQSNEDLLFKGNDGGSEITALTLDMSNAGKATFNNGLIAGGDINMSDSEIYLTDNGQVRFGDSEDLKIYHDGSNSYIKDTGIGDLYLQGSANVRITDTDGNKMFLGQDGGEVQLYYDGFQKLATKTGGITVSGIVTIDQDANAHAISIDSEATSGQCISIDGEQTTGSGIMLDMDALTTGGIISASSNSSSTGTRNLVQIINDHASASGTTPLYINQDANAHGLYLDTEATTANGIYVDADALTTGRAARFSSDSSSTGTREMVLINNSNSGATGTTVLKVQQTAPQTALLIDQNANGVALSIDNDSTTTASFYMTSKYGMQIVQDISGGKAARFERNIAEAGSEALVEIIDDHTSNTQPALKIQQDGTGAALLFENSDTATDVGDFLGKIEFKGNDATSNASGIRAHIHGGIQNTSGGAFLAFGVANTSSAVAEAMRIIADGQINFRTGATTARPSATVSGFAMTSDQFYTSAGNVTSANTQVRFYNGNGLVGNITTSGSATAFNESSDYRLKENVDYTWDATTRLKQLKPARFNWIADDTTTLDGFLAHEVSSIVPQATTGEKDGMSDPILYIEEDNIPDGKSVGDVRVASEPEYQSIDHSKLVPLLVKTIQELEARITVLEG